MAEDNFFDKFGLKVEPGQVEVGKVYPLYGMITAIVDESVDNFTVEINSGILLKCGVSDAANINKIKERAFEPGIFVAQITSAEPVTGNCTTIVFGRKQIEEVI